VEQALDLLAAEDRRKAWGTAGANDLLEFPQGTLQHAGMEKRSGALKAWFWVLAETSWAKTSRALRI